VPASPDSRASLIHSLGLRRAQELDVFVGQLEGERQTLVRRHRGQPTAFSRA
jgi:hypothetical protein